MVSCRPTGREKNIGTTGHHGWLLLVEITFGTKPEATPLLGLCISLWACLQRTVKKFLS